MANSGALDDWAAAEGQPNARCRGGIGAIDQIESRCEGLALTNFELDNKQWDDKAHPHSARPANIAVYCTPVC